MGIKIRGRLTKKTIVKSKPAAISTENKNNQPAANMSQETWASEQETRTSATHFVREG